MIICCLNGHLQAQDYSFGQAPAFVASGTAVAFGALKLEPSAPFILTDITLRQTTSSNLVNGFEPLPFFLTFSKPSAPYTGRIFLDFSSASSTVTATTSLTLAIYDNDRWLFDRASHMDAIKKIVTSNRYNQVLKALTLAIPPDSFTDSDADGVIDAIDMDRDNDGILNIVEGDTDWDNDGIPNDRDLDSDGDGCADAIEAGVMDFSTATSTTTVDNNGRLLLAEAYTLPVDADMDGEADFLQAGRTPKILSQPQKNLVITSGGIDLVITTSRPQQLTLQWEYQLDAANGTWQPLNEGVAFVGVKAESLRVNRLAHGVESVSIRAQITDPSYPCSIPIYSDVITLTYPPLFIPNAFTPNDDGKNDQWLVENIYRYKNASVYIVNRWGMLVFQEDRFNGSWDGRSNVSTLSGNGSLPEGVYFYSLILDGDSYEGFIYKR